ncbi:hypothetical protein GGTG_06750 [Gaeumannomyces tritici R3-111a-1]|uniref:Uncharacterized protein n=1 Tax=Gaeumannomyces tritici (strain R3-111a-1) TaxID=644352 RepID=J3NZQ3_GAET3|nr:hypothetical protein GGTG_06750 [Gaeumannomyces tritici R3-111a-1]EJT76836.1 hypothetical protein GGTG_06750 [Gaeumannomyces tritici R3-111a-1]
MGDDHSTPQSKQRLCARPYCGLSDPSVRSVEAGTQAPPALCCDFSKGSSLHLGAGVAGTPFGRSPLPRAITTKEPPSSRLHHGPVLERGIDQQTLDSQPSIFSPVPEVASQARKDEGPRRFRVTHPRTTGTPSGIRGIGALAAFQIRREQMEENGAATAAATASATATILPKPAAHP